MTTAGPVSWAAGTNVSEKKAALALAGLAWSRRRKRGKRMKTKTLKIRGAKFNAGVLLFTPGTLALVEQGHNLLRPLARHLHGDWGDLSDEDKAENELSLKKGYRLLSAYQLGPDTRIWIITERDRSATTILLPEEY